MRIDASTDRVGIGATSPQAKLHIADSGSDVKLLIDRTDARTYSIYTNSTSDLRIKDEDAGADRITIKSDGNVGIGNTNPTAAKLIVRQDSGYAFRTENASGYTFRIAGDTGNIEAAGDLTVSGDLTVNGTTSTINSTTVQVDDKNIELGTVGTPTDATADGGGITLKGATDKTINWINSTGAWTFSEDVVVSGTVKASSYFLGSGTEISLATTGAGSVFLRPNGQSTSGQMQLASTGYATFASGMSVGAINTTGTLDISSTYPRINLNDTNHEDDWSIINDDGNFTIYNVDDNVHALRINSSNTATFSGLIEAPAAVLSTTSTSDYVLRLLDTGVVGYDWSFPDTGTLKLGVNTTSTKTLKLINAGSGSFNLEADNVTATGLDINGAANISGHLEVGEYILRSGQGSNYHRFLASRQIFVVGNASSIDLNNGVSTFGATGGATTLQGSSLSFTGNANFSGDVSADNITSISNGGSASIYINSTRPTLGFTDSNSFTDANDIYIVRATSGNKLQFQWYDNSASSTTETFSIDDSGNATFAGDVKADTHFTSSDTNATLSTNSSGTIFLRPNGKGSTTSQSTFTTTLATIGTDATFAGNVGINTNTPAYKLHVNGGIRAGGKVTYEKSAGSLTTTGYAVAGLVAGSNGSSAGFTFTSFGHTGSYQKIVYSCHNASGTWNTQKVIDEGTNDFDVTASANGSTITFTFKSRSGTKSYTPRVLVEAVGQSLNNTYD